MPSFPPLVWYESLDSTNACALRLLDADEPLAHGWAVAARTQQAGRGQRGRAWNDAPGESLLMSTVVIPAAPLEKQPLVAFAIATAVAQALEPYGIHADLKWPNDLYSGGKKLGGILIENVLRGSRWMHAVVGTGINLAQTFFPGNLPNATSINIETGTIPPLDTLAEAVRQAIAQATRSIPDATDLAWYNERLFRRGLPQRFSTSGRLWTGILEGAEADGRLRVRAENGHTVWCVHGTDEWVAV